MTQKTLAVLAAILAAAPVRAAQFEGAAKVPAIPGFSVPAAALSRSAQPGLAPVIRLPIVAAPTALDTIKLPGTAITIAPAAQAAQTGPKALAADLGRVSKAMAELPSEANADAGSSREGGEKIEKAMTGEVNAGGAANDAVDAGAARKEAVKQAKSTVDKILAEVSKVIVGQDEMKRSILMAMIAREHVLLEGLPGVAKTQTAKAFADAVSGDFQRVQGTPDKLPSDILGSEILQENLETGKKSFELVKGPIFTNILLMDEINRMPPKAQAALLEAMAEGHVTIGRQTLTLERFTVLATQNPVEQDGTYRLPEAQLDRFMLKVLVPQPTAEELKGIIRMNRSKDARPRASKVTTLAELDSLRKLAESLTMTEEVEDYIVRVAMAASQKDLKGQVEYTVYTRASIYLDKAARIHALMNGRDYVTPSDVRAVAPQVLRHRIALSYSGQGSVEELIQTILDRTAVSANTAPAQVPAAGQKPAKR